MADVDWTAFFTALSAFAGVVFAITLAARQLSSGDQEKESDARNEYRRWESLSVTFELAAAGVFSTLYLVQGSWVAGTFSTLLSVIAWALYIVYFVQFGKLAAAKEANWLDWLLAPITFIPMTAFVLVPAAFWNASSWIWTDWFAAAVTWLVFSGTGQSLIWYINSWERPKRSSTVAAATPPPPEQITHSPQPQLTSATDSASAAASEDSEQQTAE